LGLHSNDVDCGSTPNIMVSANGEEGCATKLKPNPVSSIVSF